MSSGEADLRAALSALSDAVRALQRAAAAADPEVVVATRAAERLAAIQAQLDIELSGPEEGS